MAIQLRGGKILAEEFLKGFYNNSRGYYTSVGEMAKMYNIPETYIEEFLLSMKSSDVLEKLGVFRKIIRAELVRPEKDLKNTCGYQVDREGSVCRAPVKKHQQFCKDCDVRCCGGYVFPDPDVVDFVMDSGFLEAPIPMHTKLATHINLGRFLAKRLLEELSAGRYFTVADVSILNSIQEVFVKKALLEMSTEDILKEIGVFRTHDNEESVKAAPSTGGTCEYRFTKGAKKTQLCGTKTLPGAIFCQECLRTHPSLRALASAVPIVVSPDKKPQTPVAKSEEPIALIKKEDPGFKFEFPPLSTTADIEDLKKRVNALEMTLDHLVQCRTMGTDVLTSTVCELIQRLAQRDNKS